MTGGNHLRLMPAAATRRKQPAASLLALSQLAKGLAGVLILVMVWEFVRWSDLIDPRDLPSVVTIVRAAGFAFIDGGFPESLADTLGSWSLGLALALLTGIVIGALLATMPLLERAIGPILEFLRPIPSVALIPIALLTLGIGLEMQLAMIAFASVWPIIFATKAGVESIDPRFRDTGRILGLGRFARFTRILVPAALPAIATGLRIASALALVLAITVEMLTGRPGIGSFLQNARLDGLVPEMWAAIFLTGALGFLINFVLLKIEAAVIPWSPEHRDL